MQSPAELGHVAAICSVLSVDPENRVLVAVEGDRLTMGGQIHLGSLKVREGALARHKPQQHQTACGIIDKNEEGALWPAILEPPVLTAIDLDQFAKTIAAMARLNVVVTIDVAEIWREGLNLARVADQKSN